MVGSDLGRVLLVVGLVLAGLGALLMIFGKIPIGRLPGDIVYRRGNATFYFPIVTCIVLSLLLSLLFRFLNR
jgi:hypothetical protein